MQTWHYFYKLCFKFSFLVIKSRYYCSFPDIYISYKRLQITMKTTLQLLALLCLSILAHGQSDTWSNVPKAQDDRFTNPKSAIYAGPNGWWNFGEVRAEGSSNAAVKYGFKGGLTTNSAVFILVESGKLQVFHMDFGTENPAPGSYQVGKDASQARKTVIVSFGDVADKKIKNWSGETGSGTITVTKSGDFLYFKGRSIILQPTGIHNDGIFKQPLKVGVEGAVKQ